MKMKPQGFFDRDTGGLITIARNESEFEAASNVHCRGTREDSAFVRDVSPGEVAAFLRNLEHAK